MSQDSGQMGGPGVVGPSLPTYQTKPAFEGQGGRVLPHLRYKKKDTYTNITHLLEVNNSHDSASRNPI